MFIQAFFQLIIRLQEIGRHRKQLVISLCQPGSQGLQVHFKIYEQERQLQLQKHTNKSYLSLSIGQTTSQLSLFDRLTCNHGPRVLPHGLATDILFQCAPHLVKAADPFIDFLFMVWLTVKELFRIVQERFAPGQRLVKEVKIVAL